MNIDHIATIRQARYREDPENPNTEPDPVAAALAAEKAGAKGITVHLRDDRRHIQDLDIVRLRESVTTKLNLEMGVTEEILRIALEILPDDVCLVPENRREVTTEGGLDCCGRQEVLRPAVARLRGRGIRVSLSLIRMRSRSNLRRTLPPTLSNCTPAPMRMPSAPSRIASCNGSTRRRGWPSNGG